jgi:hypothetical protein
MFVIAAAAAIVVAFGVAVFVITVVLFLVIVATAVDAIVAFGVTSVVGDDDVQVTLISVLSPPTVTMSNIT